MRLKAKPGRKVTPTPVDKPKIHRSFAAAASASPSTLPGSSPISGDAAAGQLSASSAHESGRSAWSRPSWAGHSQHSPAPATTSSRTLACTNSSSSQPSPLLSASLSADGASNMPHQAEHNSASAARDSLVRSLEDVGISQSTQSGLQHAPVQRSTEAGPPSIPSWGQASAQREEHCPVDSAPQHDTAQAPAGRRSRSPWKRAGSGQPYSLLGHPVPQHAPGQFISDGGTQSLGAWCHTAGLQQEPHTARSPAASSAPLGISPDRQGAQAATQGSAGAASGRQTVWQPQMGRNMQETDTCLPVLSSCPSSISQVEIGSTEHSRTAAVLEGQSSADEVVEGAGEELGQQGELPDRARRVAALHSALIRHTAAVQLAAELESLFRLLGVPPAARAEAGKPTLLPSGSSAAQYACSVLGTIGMRWPLACCCPGDASLSCRLR